MVYALSRVSLVDVEDGPRRFYYRLVSTSLTERLGYEMTRRYVDDIPDEEMRAYVEALYARAVDLRAPLYERSKRLFSNKIWNHEALVLPLSSDGNAIIMVMPSSPSAYRRLACYVLSERGIAAVWQLHLDVLEAHLAGFPGAAALLLRVADAAEDLVWCRTQVTEAAQADRP